MGLVIAPRHFGPFGGDLLVGNFGDGAIHAYDPGSVAEEGQLMNRDGNPIKINGLWALRFGNGVTGTPNDLLFTAGIGDEGHGLFGEIRARTAIASSGAVAVGLREWAPGRLRRYFVAIRSAPSSLITAPLSISSSTMCVASAGHRRSLTAGR